MDLNLLQVIPHRFTVVTHYSDRAVPDMDTRQKHYGITQTTQQLDMLFRKGKLLSFHAMNMHYSNWMDPAVPRPTWLHCLPIGMRLRFYQPYDDLLDFLNSIKKNVIDRPSSFWNDSSRPLLLVPFTRKFYARDRAKALRELTVNVKKKILVMTQRVYDRQIDFFNAVSTHRFTLCPWGNGLDTHRLYEVLVMGGIPVVRKSSINSCMDGTDNDIAVEVVNAKNGSVHIDSVKRGNIPLVVVERWSEVTTDLLEKYWKYYSHVTNSEKIDMQSVFPAGHDELGQWDYSRATMLHWRKRILGYEENGGNVLKIENNDYA